MEKVASWAITEPDSGSDAFGGMRTYVRRDGEDYILNGQKTFISNGLHCDLLVIVARTGGEGAQGLSLLVAETPGLEGFNRGRKLDKMGLKAQDTAELHFDGVRVPPSPRSRAATSRRSPSNSAARIR